MYYQFYELVKQELGEFEVKITAGAILWRHHTTFGEISAKKDCMVIGFPSDILHSEWQPAKTVQTSKNRIAHYFEITGDSRFSRLVEGLKQAYRLTAQNPVRQKTAEKKTFATVDAYIADFPAEQQAILNRIRAVIRQAAPQAEERMSWQMPTYHLKENLVHFALQKNHIGFYPSPGGIEAFREALSPYKTTKGGIQFPLEAPIPYDLIEKITLFRVAEAQR